MGFFRVACRHGRCIKTLSNGYSQKSLDSIKMIVSDFLSEGNFNINKLFRYPTLSKGYSDTINMIVENGFLAKRNTYSMLSDAENKGGPALDLLSLFFP
jgi:hypothetical protein